jgi:hypothetical protein
MLPLPELLRLELLTVGALTELLQLEEIGRTP